MVKSFVGDILMPPISIILPLHRNIEEKFAVLRPGPNYNASTGYTTLHIAQDDGAVVLAYGVSLGPKHENIEHSYTLLLLTQS